MSCTMLYHLTLRILRRLISTPKAGSPFKKECLDADAASDKILELLNTDKGIMIARYGSFELLAVTNHIGTTAGPHPWRYITGHQDAWWWNLKTQHSMEMNTGFFPATSENLGKFGEMMIRDSQELDFLGSWTPGEKYLFDIIASVPKAHLPFLEPFWAKKPWTAALKNKKVLVVHPFAKSILEQYSKRHLLFKNPDMLPDFASLKVIPAVQSIGGGNERFSDWFEALDWMKDEIDKSDYDVCLIGCGAYGFPLAAHVKRQGKKAIHLGGALQLLFGIWGKRWENPEHGVERWGLERGAYKKLLNKHWVRPSDDERPAAAANVEGACYW